MTHCDSNQSQCAAASSDCVALLRMNGRISHSLSTHSAMFFICSAGDGSDSELDRNSLYGEICLGKGVRNNRDFVIPVFVICMNAYNGKERGEIRT